MIGNGSIQFRERRMTMFGPLIRVPATHGSDPGSSGNILAARGKCVLDFANRGGVFEDSVIPGTVAQADDVDVGLHQSGYDRAPSQIDDANAGSRFRRRPAYGDDAVMANRDAVGDKIGGVNSVDLAVDQNRGGLVQAGQCSCLGGQFMGDRVNPDRRCGPRTYPQEPAARRSTRVLSSPAHFFVHGNIRPSSLAAGLLFAPAQILRISFGSANYLKVRILLSYLVELQVHAEVRLHGLQPFRVALGIPLDPLLIVHRRAPA